MGVIYFVNTFLENFEIMSDKKVILMFKAIQHQDYGVFSGQTHVEILG